MKAVVLAAGKGQRLKGFIDNVPKPMVEIAGKPILRHNIEWLKSFGVTDIYINLHHLPVVITRHFGDGVGEGMRIKYSYEPNLLGTAGAVKKIASEFWQDKSDEPFLVIYGDNLVSDFDLNRIIIFHKQKQGTGTICLYRKPEEVAKSGVAVLDKNDRIVKFIEKPSMDEIPGDLVNTGIYCLEPAILKYIPENSPCDFGKDVFGRAIDDGAALYGLVFNANLVAIDTPQLFQKLVAPGAGK
ncbi:MAG: nucleotidyltransferase family protein [Planctomycetota bacterium]